MDRGAGPVRGPWRKGQALQGWIALQDSTGGFDVRDCRRRVRRSEEIFCMRSGLVRPLSSGTGETPIDGDGEGLELVAGCGGARNP